MSTLEKKLDVQSLGRLLEAIDQAEEATFRIANVATSHFRGDEEGYEEARKIAKEALEANRIIRALLGREPIEDLDPYLGGEAVTSDAGEALRRLQGYD